MSLTKKLAEVSLVVEERGKTYGHPSVDFDRVARIKAVLDDCTDPEIRHALTMIAVKMCRLVETPDHEDSWVDIVGYATTAAMIIDQRKETTYASQLTGALFV